MIWIDFGKMVAEVIHNYYIQFISQLIDILSTVSDTSHNWKLPSVKAQSCR